MLKVPKTTDSVWYHLGKIEAVIETAYNQNIITKETYEDLNDSAHIVATNLPNTY